MLQRLILARGRGLFQSSASNNGLDLQEHAHCARLHCVRTIRALPPEEVEKIAAGEVVERPVSVVKELIENSLDADASEITVEIEDGGKALIRVTDNGEGISFDELPLAVKNFHTSKISACEDIYHQTSLGFRGEALASISAVSRLVLTSRVEEEEVGGEIVVEGGQVLSRKRLAFNRGTTVEVRDLFFNTPVRRKFLRSKATESFHVVNLLKNYILAFENVAFKLVMSGKVSLESQGKGRNSKNLTTVFGAEIAEKMVRFEKEYPPLGIEGYIAPPSLFSEERKLQYFFVNRRPVKNRVLFRAVDDGFHEYLSANKYPPLAIMLDIPPEEVDVNIHPTKNEVAFMHQQQVYSAVIAALKEAFGELFRPSGKHILVGVKPEEPVGVSSLSDASRVSRDAEDRPKEREGIEGVRLVPVFEMGEPVVSERGSAPFESLVPFLVPDADTKGKDAGMRLELMGEEDKYGEEAIVNLTPQLKFPSFIDIGGNFFACQLFDTFILLASDEEVTLIDQHSAHERVIFEKLWRGFSEDASFVQDRHRLLFPVEIDADEATLELLAEKKNLLEKMGFRLTVGHNEIIVEDVPRMLLAYEAEERIPAIVLELLTFDSKRLWDDKVKDVLSVIACRSAVKAGDKLKPMEIRILLEEVLRINDWQSCPHGRPTILRMKVSDLQKLFLRN